MLIRNGRDGYQRNWTWAFDPIGLRIGIDKQKLAADLTITPLIMNSEYDMFMEISKGAHFESRAGDPHKATRAGRPGGFQSRISAFPSRRGASCP